MANLNHIRKDYIGRINRVMNYIEENLDQELSLDSIAKEAYYSSFHFHRIFTAITNETLNAFINRKRLEKIAAHLLVNNNEVIMAELAMGYGFKNASSFSRSFKKFYGISPSEFKENAQGKYSKIRKALRKNGKEEITFEQYICSITHINNWLEMNAKIEIKEIEKINLAYVSHVGEFDQIGIAYEKLIAWAKPNGLLDKKPNFISVYHDDPRVTDVAKLRQSAGIILDENIKTEGEIGKLTIEKGRYVVGRFEIKHTQFNEAWNSMNIWVAENGYTLRDWYYFERYHNNYLTHPENKSIVDICIPIV